MQFQRHRYIGISLLSAFIAFAAQAADPAPGVIIGHPREAARDNAESAPAALLPAPALQTEKRDDRPATANQSPTPANAPQQTSFDRSEKKQAESTSRRRSKVIALPPPKTSAGVADLNAHFDLPRQITMYVGEIKVLPLKIIDTVAVGSGKVISTTVVHKDRDLMLLAEDAGESSLFIWDKAGRGFSTQVRVNVKDVERIKREVGEALGGLTPQVTVRNIGEKVVIEGKNLSPEASALVNEVSKAYPQVTNLTTSQGVADRSFADMIHFDLKFLEVKKSAESDLGVKWDSSTSGGLFFGLLDDIFMNQSNGFRVIPSSTDSSTDWTKMPGNKSTKWYFGSSMTLGSVINLMVTKGDAFILASPKLTTRRGGKAKFLAGGEIPLTSISTNGATSITFKQYGIVLNIKADWTPESIISGSVEAEVSSIDPSVTIHGNPGFLTRRTENEFSLHDGDTIVLSGLISKEGSKTVDQLPLLGDIPILGHFFKNNDDTNKDNELLIFITPRLVTPSSSLNVQTIEKSVSNFNEQTRKVNGSDVLPGDPLKPQGDAK